MKLWQLVENEMFAFIEPTIPTRSFEISIFRSSVSINTLDEIMKACVNLALNIDSVQLFPIDLVSGFEN